MASSSPRGKSKSAAELMTPEEFKARIGLLVEAAKEIEHLKKESNRARKQNEKDNTKGSKDGKLVKDGREITYRGLDADLTAVHNQLKKLSSVYRKTYSKRRMPRAKALNNSFERPVRLSQEVINLFNDPQFDLGTITIGGSVGNVKDLIRDLVRQGYANRSILSAMLSLYAKEKSLYRLATSNRGLPEDAMNRQLLGADEVLNRNLGGVFTAFEQESLQKLASAGKREGDKKDAKTKKGVRKYVRKDGTQNYNDFEHAFNRNNFSYASFQSLFKYLIGKIEDPKDANGNLIEADRKATLLPTTGRAFIDAITAAVNNGSYMSNGMLPMDIAARVDPNDVALRLRANLYFAHAVIKVASEQYDTVNPRKAKKPAARKA